jgi:hypothetical protein
MRTHEQTPLHEVLWSLGRSLIHGKTEPKEPADHLHHRMQELTVQQLTTSMRMHGIKGEEETMLSSLEAMVQAGEISFEDFIGRVQNLFPKTLDALDVSLRMKIAARVIP